MIYKYRISEDDVDIYRIGDFPEHDNSLQDFILFCKRLGLVYSMIYIILYERWIVSNSFKINLGKRQTCRQQYTFQNIL